MMRPTVSLPLLATLVAVAEGMVAGEPAQGVRPPALTVVATNEAERKAAADLLVEPCWPIEVVESCTDAVDFTRADFIDEFARGSSIRCVRRSAATRPRRRRDAAPRRCS